MNPAHLFLVSLGIAAIFWLGYWAAHDDMIDFFPTILFILINLACAVSIIASGGMMLHHFLDP